MDEMLGAASALVARLRLGRSRRWRAGLKGRRLHVRRTLRGSLQTGGEPLKPAWLEHPHRKPRIVLLLDGSRSMSLYSGRLLQFAHALTRRAARVEVFLFSTELKRVTPSLKRTTHAPTLRDLGAAWGGGTRIGACLATFAKRHGGTLTRDTLVIVASDGLDTGRPEALGRALREVQRASAGVLWLNPLLNTKRLRAHRRGDAGRAPLYRHLYDGGERGRFRHARAGAAAAAVKASRGVRWGR